MTAPNTVEATLQTAKMPIHISGCALINGQGGAYDLQSRGPLGGKYGTLFHARGDIVEIVGTGKFRLRGYQRFDVPIDQHVKALRDLGFHEVVFPNGRRYQLRK